MPTMNLATHIVRFLNFINLICLLTLSLSAAPLTPTPAAEATPASKAEVKAQRLIEVVTTLDSLSLELQEKNRALKQTKEESEREQLIEEAKQIEQERDKLEQSFEEIVSNVIKTPSSEPSENRELQLEEELKSLLAPIITELKKITARPREIERLNSLALELNQRLSAAQMAISNIDALLQVTEDKSVAARIAAVKEKWTAELQTTKTELAVTKQKLEQREQSQLPISSSLRNILALFFRTRGKNLLLATLIGLTCWLLASRLYNWLAKSSYLVQQRDKVPVRLLGIIVYFFTIIGSTSAFLLTLYMVGDWILLVLSSALIFAAAWSSKHAISQFWSTVVLLLNMGPVREGEVVNIDGVLWLVDRLNVYSSLTNPWLTGGILRLPAFKLQKTYSRRKHENELWFPTQQGDWIFIKEQNTYGQVVFQSPELITVQSPGGAITQYPTNQFVQLSPQVLSRGFRLTSIFGVDYSHQQVLISEILPQLQHGVHVGLNESGFQEHLRDLKVQVKQAGASSLDLAILCDFKGSCADNWDTLQRLITRLCIEECNKQGWIIPFTQITLHTDWQKTDRHTAVTLPK